MSLSQEELKHDWINLRRLVKRLDITISNNDWAKGVQHSAEDAWVTAHGMTQKIRYARQLLLNVDTYQELDSTLSSPASRKKDLQTIRETLDRLDNAVDVVKKELEPEPIAETSYLSLVPLPATEEKLITPGSDVVEPSFEPSTLKSPLSEQQLLIDPTPDPALDLLPSSTPRIVDTLRASSIKPPPETSSLLSASLQTHEELSDELARMATQLKRNAQHFSESLDKDKSIVQSAAEALEKNYDTMTKERTRLKDHRGKSFGTTWMVFGALLVVSIAWIMMFFIIRLT